ncbi:calmodulin-binding protein 60 B [Spinacia oleracea]|uniref:Calmodulin-binding protein 60 B n=1 Tax=Spinacia oleracea TaxID=3562 RepID=A0A9R0J324_SPIOL|nr:calmodulin-binding protein 60 B-like [Spinacia oleracea]
MAPKRGLSGVSEDGNNNNGQYHHTKHSNHCLMFTKYLFKDKSWPQKYSAQLENIIRKMVREGVDDAVQRSPLSNSISNSRSFPSRINPSESRQFKLQFDGELPRTLFTGNKVKAEGPSPVKILLLDAVSGHPIKDGPLSSIKVEIVVLHGHFKAEQLEEWTKKDFCTHMVLKRNNKGSLLVGQCVIALQNGIGFVDNVCFTDNSSWGRTKRFRLGAKVVAEEDQVKEAVSRPFQVKDRRGETYQKHDIPSLDDEVWRLCWIAKDGKICKKLEENEIYKVKDFITQYHSNESLLRSIVEVSPKKWKEIIQHATSCFSGDVDACMNLNNSAQINIPSGSAINPITVPCSNLQPLCVNDQQILQMSQFHAGEHSNQLPDQSMDFDNSFLEGAYTGLPNDVHLPYQDYSMPSSSSTMFNVQTSSWPPDQLFTEEATRMLSSIHLVSANASETANPKAGAEER